ncbi:hypothetical protein BC628DRAFT_1406685 [Trametes gibbosa]|uniref:Uncharacterized protein n=1 Tax=Trametes gibbosa TaxID=160864 RepID=A0A6G6FQF3_9APHY|nr:hypothetical protein BC628DRAFT_1406685 [Trametes gibbosa]QIE48525.1 hypothetical protein [Trametes gibbosa]
MSDARALLRAKRQEARIDHPLASYNAAGVLRCIACGTSVKHAAAWDGHIGSKTHRTNAARMRAERAREEQRLAAERENSLKRKSMEVEGDEGGEDEAGEDAETKGSERPVRKAARVESAEVHEPGPAAAASARSALPADFFSDPSQAPAPPEDGEEEAADGAPSDALDLEWAQFQESVVNAPDVQETYERATIMAEPVVALEVPQGFPGASEEAEEAVEVLDEEGVRRQRAQDERELIMDRLMEEEQAQEEADARVSQLKTKLEALKKRREAARTAKQGAKTS